MRYRKVRARRSVTFNGLFHLPSYLQGICIGFIRVETTVIIKPIEVAKLQMYTVRRDHKEISGCNFL